MTPPSSLRVTRVIHACVLIELGDAAVLTDPYFMSHWWMRMREPIALRPDQLPRLTAVLGGHGVFDHWRPQSMGAYPHKDTTPAWVATPGMVRAARAAGFADAEVVDWGTRRALTDAVTLDVVVGQRTMGMRTNSYALRGPGASVFVGTEAHAHQPLADYRAARGPVDVAVLPIDGSRFLGRPLVMDPAQAVAGAQALGASTLIPIHYGMVAVPFVLRTPGTLDALQAAAEGSGVRVVVLVPGQPWRRH